MAHRLLWLNFLFFFLAFRGQLQAQNTITTQTLSVATICPGSPLDVSFSRTGTYNASNTFTVQLSDGSAYKDIVTGAVSFNSSTNTYTVSATIPSETPAGTTYSLRVTASNPAVIGTPSTTKLTVKTKPAPPTVDEITYACQVTGNADRATDYFYSLYVKGKVPGTNLRWSRVDGSNICETFNNYGANESNKNPILLGSGCYPPGQNYKFYVSQIQPGDACESDKAITSLTVRPSPTLLPPTASVGACQGDPIIDLKNKFPAPNGFYYQYSGPTIIETNQSKVVEIFTSIYSNEGCVGYDFINSAPQRVGTTTGKIVVNVNIRPTKPTTSTATVSLCQFQASNSLSASPTGGASLVWYGTNATGGSGSLITPFPSTLNVGTFKYYVAQKLNDCESDRSEITVEIKAASPAPTVSGVSYCQSVPASQLSAVAASGGSLLWYTTSTGGSSSPTAPTPPTNAVGTQTYYVTQTVGNSCESQRMALVVTVNGAPAAPVISTPAYISCQYATGEVLQANGQNLKWYDVASGGTSAGSITANTSVAGTKLYYVSQTINSCEGPRSSVMVTILAAPAAPTVSQTTYEFCQKTLNATITGTVSSASQTGWYVYGDEPGLVNFYTNGNTAYAVISTDQARNLTYSLFQTAANGCKGPASPQINITIKPTPNAPGVQSVAVCQNAAAPVLQPTGQNLSWYTTSTGGTGSATTPLVSTSQASQTTYYVSQSLNGCESLRAALSVTVNAIPGVPVVSATGPAYCQNAAASPLTATGQNLKWYATSSGGTGTNSLTPKTDSAGTYTYYVSQTVNGCEGSRSSITVKISAAPAVPTVASSYSYCQKAATASLIATGTLLKWYDSAGNALPGAPKPSSDFAGTVNYSVTQTVDNCESAKTPIRVTVKPTPVAPGTSALSVCQNAPAQALSAVGQNLSWYTSDTTRSVASIGSFTIGTGQAGSTTYYVSQTIDGCEGPRSALVATIKPLPGVPTVSATGLGYCQYATASSLTATGQSLNWYREPSGGTSLGEKPVPDTKDAGSYTYYVSQTVDGCEGSRSSITVKVSAAPLVPAITSTFSYCQKATATVLTATGNALKWYDATGKSSDTAPTPATEIPGTQSYFVTQTVDNCESARAEIKVTTKPTPVAPGTSVVSVCQNTPAQVLSATGQNLNWYTTSTGGTGSTVAPTLNTSRADSSYYFVSQTIDGCEGPRTILVATVKPLPAAPNVSQKNICQFTKPESLSVSGEGITWYSPDGSKGPNNPIPATDKGATFSYTVTQTVAGCEGPKATLIVNIQSTPAPAVSKPVVELCQGSIPQPLEATGTNLRWTDPTGVVSTTAPAPSTLDPTTKADGDLYYVTQTGTTGCESSKVAIKVFVQTAPTVVILGTATTNLGLEVPLKLTFTGVGPYRFKLSNGLSGTAIKDTTVLVLPDRTTIYQVTEVANKCGVGSSGNAGVTVTVLVPTIQTLAFATTTICAGARLTTNYATSGSFNAGSVFKLQIAKVEADSTKAAFVDVPGSQAANGQIAGNLSASVAAGQYWIRVVATNPKIPINGTFSPTKLTIRSQATATLTGNQMIFEGSSATLSVAFTGDGPWSFAYRDSTAGGAGTLKTVQTSDTPFKIEVRPAKTTSYYLTNVSNGCGNGTTAGGIIVVNVSPLLGIEDQTLAEAVDIYPVPTTNTLTVRIRGLSTKQPARLELSDLNGRTMLLHETGRETSVLSLDHQPAGTYILHIRVGDRTASKRVLKL